ncbi:MAG: MBL fold metallo-hydrolase [candidate division WOR-3 bacterium]|nr:MBL fold metallo-hydrolase [candidate division WOR-3 bacterium]
MNSRDNFQFKVTILGSGSCVPQPDRYPSSYFIQPPGISGGWLVDLGSGALQHLAEIKENYQEIQSVFISHVHPDHISSLLPFLQALNYTPNFKRKEPLFIYGSWEVKEYLKRNLGFSISLRRDFPLEFVELRDKEIINQEGWSLIPRSLKHSSPTLGFRWEVDGCILVYGADSQFCDALLELAEGANLLILESSFRKDDPKPGHLTTFQAGKIALKSSVEKLLLSHLYPGVGNLSLEKRESEVRTSGYKGEIIFAEDLMRLNITPR